MVSIELELNALSGLALNGSQCAYRLGPIIAAMNSGNQITARIASVVPGSTGRSSSKVTVELSGAPDPRWLACFNFVVQGRDGFFMQDRPVFDRGTFEGEVLAEQIDAFRLQLPEVVAAANVLANAQANKDASRLRR